MSIKHIDTHISKSTKRITTPLVSTLICTYNAEAFFTPTIKSVLAQTHIHQEILIRDDGSSDRTVQMLHDRAEQDDRITIFVDPWTKRGAYGGLNFLLDQANWTYIAIQDHDDIWHPTKLEKQVAFLETHHQYEGVWSRFRCYFEAIDSFGEGIGIDAGGDKKIVHHTSLMYRKTHKRYDLNHERFTDFYFCRDTLGEQYELSEVYMIHRKRAWGKNLFNNWTSWFWSRRPLRRSNPRIWSLIYHLFLALFGARATLRVSRNITRRGSYISHDEFVEKYSWARMK